MTRLPIIGITTDYKEKENTYSKYPWFALRRHYSDCLYKFGCTPVILPITETLENLDFLDGLLISGGDFDIDDMTALSDRHPKPSHGRVVG